MPTTSKAKRPTAKFYIVGSLPPGNIQAVASDDIIITGFVDDLEAFLSDACLMDDPTLRNSIAQKGYDMVRQHYSWEEKLRGYEKL